MDGTRPLTDSARTTDRLVTWIWLDSSRIKRSRLPHVERGIGPPHEPRPASAIDAGQSQRRETGLLRRGLHLHHPTRSPNAIERWVGTIEVRQRAPTAWSCLRVLTLNFRLVACLRPRRGFGASHSSARPDRFNMEDLDPKSADIRDLLRPVWSHRILMVVVVAVTVSAVYVLDSSRTKRYRAATDVLLTRSAAEAAISNHETALSDRTANNQAKLLASQAVARRVRAAIGFAGTSDELIRAIDVETTAGSDVLSISAESTSGQQAAGIANGFAQAFVELGSASVNRELNRSIASSNAQLRRLGTAATDRGAREQLTDQIRRLRVAQGLGTARAQQLDRAAVPATPFSPRPTRDAAFAFAISLFLATAFAIGLQRVDRRIHKPEDLEAAYGEPILAIIPHANDTHAALRGQSQLGKSLREPFRTLRTGIGLASIDRPIRTLVVTSAAAGEGKSTVVRNLALAYAEMGLRVLAVEFDMRRPSLGALFDVDDQLGVTHFFAGEQRLEDVIVVSRTLIDEINTTGVPQSAHTHGGEVSVLLRGGPVSNPGGLLASDGTKQLVAELARRFDVTIFDTAPIGAVSDAVPLLSQVDGVVLVGRLDYTSRDAVRRTRGLLTRIPGHRVVGVVANDLSDFEAGYGYGYGYGYGSDYAAKPARS